MTAILGKIGTLLPDGGDISRLGPPKPNYCRAIKLNTQSKINRDSILQKSKVLKEVGEPFCNVYLKKDLHPVIVQENARLRKKRKELQRLHTGNEIKMDNGKLMVDGVVVDRNMFFR